MIIPAVPVTPVIPILVRLVSAASMSSMLEVVVLIGLSVLVGWILKKIMHSKGFRTSLIINLILSGMTALAVYLRYGFTVTAVQGMALFFILLYASCSDITSHTMDDYLWVMIGILGICSVETVGLSSMLLGALAVFTPQILIALIPPHKSLGGADIKLSVAIAFLLGWQKGVAALMLGLLLAVVVMSIVQKMKKNKRREPFALIPFLSVAALILFII